jgi:acyl carrier protein
MTAERIDFPRPPVREPSAVRTGPLDGVLAAIYEAIANLNLQLPLDQRIEKSPATVLFGAGGKLDSLGLANFIVLAEQKLEERLGLQVNLTEDDPFSPLTGHFRTIQSLATYVAELRAKR